MRRIDWTTPAHVVEKIIEYDAVHEIRGWSDLRRRLQKDRRCYAFFHPALTDDPVIFVEVALTDELTSRIADLLDQRPPADPPPDADTAIFYSINNCLPGLRGIEFGSFLLKRVVDELQVAEPALKRFSTLSPIPGFVEWLRESVGRSDLGWLRQVAPELVGWARSDAPLDIDVVSVHREPLESACAQYLVEARRGQLPLDPVARFHLRNGARLERINWLGDISENGLAQSAGMLANYLYVIDDLDTNHENLVNDGVIVRARAVDALLESRPQTATPGPHLRVRR